jgi:hypothetical protein
MVELVAEREDLDVLSVALFGRSRRSVTMPVRAR